MCTYNLHDHSRVYTQISTIMQSTVTVNLRNKPIKNVTGIAKTSTKKKRRSSEANIFIDIKIARSSVNKVLII